MEVQAVHQESPRTFLDRLQAEVGIDGPLLLLSSPFSLTSSVLAALIAFAHGQICLLSQLTQQFLFNHKKYC